MVGFLREGLLRLRAVLAFGFLRRLVLSRAAVPNLPVLAFPAPSLFYLFHLRLDRKPRGIIVLAVLAPTALGFAHRARRETLAVVLQTLGALTVTSFWRRVLQAGHHACALLHVLLSGHPPQLVLRRDIVALFAVALRPTKLVLGETQAVEFKTK